MSLQEKDRSITSRISALQRKKIVKTTSQSRSRAGSIISHYGDHKWRASGKDGFKVPKYKNTYRLEPYLPFSFQVSDKILENVMLKYLKNVTYGSDAANKCQDIASDVRDHLYKTDYDRVKYLVIITIIEKANQSFTTSHGRLWDAEIDTYSTYVYESETFWATGLVFVTYYE